MFPLQGNQPDETIYADDVFSVDLYDGNGGASQTIINGIDLAGQGGMVWNSSRATAQSHPIQDSVRGAGAKLLYSDLTVKENEYAQTLITSFNSNGYTISTPYTSNGYPYVNWTFRKAPKFFDVQTATVTGGVDATVSFSGLSTLGCVIVKRTDSTGSWYVWHRSLTAGKLLYLEQTAAEATLGHVTVSGTTVTLEGGVIADGTYIVYGFAHDTGTDGIIQCGSFTTDGSGNATVNLGWEPQYVMTKVSSAVGYWYVADSTRGMPVSTLSVSELYPNVTNPEAKGNITLYPTATGFQNGALGASSTYIYLAIRRSNKPPTVGTQVFQPTTYTGTNVDNRLINTTIAPDMVWLRKRSSSTMPGMVVADRMRGNAYLLTGATAAEVTAADAMDAQLVSAVEYGNAFSSMSGVWVGNNTFGYDGINIGTTGSDHIAEAFKRAKGFFDVVCYTGTGVAHTEAHQLGVVPELMIVRGRDARSWYVYFGNATENLILNGNFAKATSSTLWNSTTPTSTVFSVDGSNAVNQSSITYVAFLFSTLAGISKVGTYTGNGTSQTINCGFTTGARFVMIKRTDSTGDWYVYDTARGIVAGNDYHLSLNTTAAEVVTTDDIDADNSGFVVNQNATTNLNVTSATYCFLAIA